MTRFGSCCPVVVMALQGGFDEARDQVGTTPKVVYEINENLDDLGQGTLQCRFNGIVFVLGGGTGTYEVWVGGTINTPDVTKVAEFTTVSATEEQKTDLGVSFLNPAGGMLLVKIVAYGSGAGVTAKIRGAKYIIG